MLRHGWRRAVGVVVVAAVAAGCSSQDAADERPGRSDRSTSTSAPLEAGAVAVDVSAQHAATLTLPGGGKVVVPKGAVVGRGRLVATPLSPDRVPAPPAGMVSVAPPVDLTLEGAELTGALEITRPVAADAGRSVQAAFDERTKAWEFEAGLGDDAGHRVVTRIEHLSIRDWFKVDLSWAREYVKKLLLGSMGDQVAPVEPVRCAADDHPGTQGWSVRSSKEPRVTWCLDRSGNGRTLVIRNGNRFPVMVSGPDGFDVQRPVLPLALGSLFVKFEEGLFSSTRKTYRLAQRRDDLRIDLGPLAEGRQATFRIEGNLTATLTQFLQLDIDLALQLLAKLPEHALPSSLRKLRNPKALLESAGLAQCVVAAFNASDLTLDAQRSSNPVDLAAKASRCVAGELQQRAPGLAGFVVNALVAVLSLPGDLIGTGVTGFSLASNDIDYRITVARAAPVAAVPGPDGALPTVLVTAENAKEFGQLLAGLDLLDDADDPSCYSLEVFGVDFASRSADIEVGYSASSEDPDCGGDSLGTIVQVRNGAKVAEHVACGDCMFETDTEGRYAAVVDRYRGRTRPVFDLGPADDGAGIVGYQNVAG